MSFSLNTFFEILTVIGFVYFLFKRFVLKEAPVPASALSKVDRNQITEALALLKKREKTPGEPYKAPEHLMRELTNDLHNEETLRSLLCDIAAHVGIDGQYIRLQFQDDYTKEYAGNIATNGAFTTINLQLHEFYTPEVITAVLAHEVMHLYLLYQGVHFSDTLKNEVLTDTAAVYYGFGEYLQRGYQVMETKLGFSYHKVGYIRPEDVRFIEEQIRRGI
ncbi:MAG: hypothetical protein J6J79_03940 [Lachnospiraceae bacterium]|nr:hypothetical protein [Lachnospiraceae bacterium]